MRAIIGTQRTGAAEELRVVSAFVVRSIIAGEDHQGAIFQAEILDLANDLSHVVVETRDHGGESALHLRP